MKEIVVGIFLLVLMNISSIKTNAQSNLSDSLKIDSAKKILLTQNEDSNKVNTLNWLSENTLAKRDFQNAMQYAKDALKISESINYKKGKANAYYNVSSIMGKQSYTDRTLYPEIHSSLSNALKLYEELGNNEGIALCYEGFAGLNYNEGDYAEALKNNFTALKFHEKSGDENSIASIYRKIAYVYDSQNNISEALKYYQVCLKLNIKAGDSTLIAGSYLNIGRMYFMQENYDEALKEDFEGLKILKVIKNPAVIPYAYENIGNVYKKQGEIAFAAGDKVTSKIKLQAALDNYLVALKMLQEINYIDGLAQLYGFLGNVYTKLNNFKLANLYLEKSLGTSLQIGYNEQIKDAYLGLSVLDSMQGNYKQAYNNYKLYISLRDKLANEESTKKSVQTKLQYEFDKKETAAKIAQEKKDAEAKRLKNLQYLAIAVLAVVVLSVIIIAFILWRNNMHKQKANVLLQQQKEKVESTLTELKSTQAQLIQSEKMASLGELTAGIAHEIQNPLNFVNNFSDVNKELLEELKGEADKGNIYEVKAIANDVIENEEKVNHHGKRAASIVKGMLQHSRGSIGKKELTDINALTDEYLRLSYHGLRAKDKSFNATMETHYDESIEKINIIPQDIGRVILNLFTNAFYSVSEKKKLLKDGYTPTVSVTTKNIKDAVQIIVRDNGNGIPQKILDKIYQPFFTTKPTGQGTGLGLSLSYDIINAHGGEIKAETKEGEFAEFIIKLPYS